MKKDKLFLVVLLLVFSFLTGCAKTYNISEALGASDTTLDKVIFEKNRGDCVEVTAVYFKGDNITKVETRETYTDKDSLSKAYESYSESKDYSNLRSSGLDIGYEYSSARIYNSFEGIRGKDNIVDILQKDRGYVLK